ncbi:hypothetical protein, partial [Amycolatopsis cihanbeyliensis]
HPFRTRPTHVKVAEITSLLIACRRRHLTLFPRYRRGYAADFHHGLPAKVKIPAQEFPASSRKKRVRIATGHPPDFGR